MEKYINEIIDIIENHPGLNKAEILQKFQKNADKKFTIPEIQDIYKKAKERYMNGQGKISEGTEKYSNKGHTTEEVIKKAAEGKSQREIAKELGVTRADVQYHIRKNKKEIQVLHPSHYNTKSYECWDVFKEIAEQNNMRPAESALFFNVFKYVWRYKSKDGVKDLEKAKNCIDELIKILGE